MPMTAQFAGILLAAGQSTRFGSNKLLQSLPHSNTPMVVQAALNLLAALPDSVAVVRDNDHAIKLLLGETGIRIIDNPDSNLGMSSSIRCGVKYYLQNPYIKGYVVALADMPYIPSQIFNQVADALQQGALIAAPEYTGRRGHPVGFSGRLTSDLLNLQGDTGAKALIEKYRHSLQLIEVDSETVLLDIDEPKDII
jgi:molybdenum cofactor cytidylyltransferase